MRDWRAVNCSSTIRGFIIIIVSLMKLYLPPDLPAYSVLSHQTLVDAAWETDILPLLRERFPGAPPDDLVRSHGFAIRRRHHPQAA
jgi:hypothetical protein